MSLYKNLAHQFIEDIQARRLLIGTRLPALRILAKQHSVSITTATKAYDYLQQTGWIYALPQSGYFVTNHVEASHFPILTVLKTEQRDPKRFAPTNGYNPTSTFFSPLGTSMLSPELQPSKSLKRCIKRVASRAYHSLFEYPELQGDKGLRNALSEHFRKQQFAFSPNELVITNGCIDAIRTAIESTTKEGDAIAVSAPCFSGLLDLLSALSRHIIEIPCNEQGLDLDQLEICLKQNQVQASLFSTSHLNPTGITLSMEQKKKLAELATAYKIPMIEDDVYLELGHQKLSSLPAKHWDKEGNIIWCGSVSKTLAAGLRVGWCLPGKHLAAYVKLHALTSFGVNSFAQTCLAEFINTGEYQSHVNKTRLALGLQRNQYRQFLRGNLPSEANISAPEGGLVLWIQIPNLAAVQLEEAAQNQGIDIRSGACFSTHSFYHNCFRVNCGWPLDEHGIKNSAFQQLTVLCQLVPKFVN